MADEATTGADNQPAGDAPADDQTPTDSRTDDGSSSTGGDNPDPSKSTDDTPADGDKPADGGQSPDDSTPKFDDDLADWAEKTGRKKPETDDDRKLLQEVRDGQREFSRTKAAKKAAEGLNSDAAKLVPENKDDDDDEDDPIEKRLSKAESDLAAERLTRIQSEFFGEHDVEQVQVDEMGKILKEKVDSAVEKNGGAGTKEGREAGKKVLDYLTDPDNLPDWLALAKTRLSSGDAATDIGEEAARKERERIEKESKAGGAQRNASTTTVADKTLDQERLERFSSW